MPQFVNDAPGGGKVPINPDYIEKLTDDEVVFRNYEGKQFRYPLKPGVGVPAEGAEAADARTSGMV